MSEQRICKECGKPFTPKGREKYCSNIHYRLCPICGEPVIVTYFSDPARRCEKCRHIKGSQVKMVPRQIVKIDPQPEVNKGSLVAEVIVNHEDLIEEIADKELEEKVAKIRASKEIPETIDQSIFCEATSNTVMTYIGNKHNNSFIPGHDYLIVVERDEYTYRITSCQDITTGDECDIIINYASQISFHRNFAKVS